MSEPTDTRYLPPSVDALGLRTARCRVSPAPGLTFQVVVDERADDPLSQAFRRGDHPAADIFRLLQSLVGPGAPVLDLGAHVGAFALAAAAAGHPVLAVEASPQNAALLQASAQLNGWAHLRVVHAGVSDRPGELRFVVDGPYGHVATEGESQDRRTVAVPAVTVDALLAELGWPRPDFVKMDIEGSEVAALAGMKLVLSGPDAPALFCESNSHTLDLFGQTPQSLKAALAAGGMRCLLLGSGGLIDVSPAEPQGPVVVDYLAVKQLPAALRALPLQQGVPVAELVAQLRGAASGGALPGRLHAARTLRDAPQLLQAHPALQALARDLQADEEPSVALAAARLPLPARRPWWRRLAG
jgi:FkbM family methyltransferase